MTVLYLQTVPENVPTSGDLPYKYTYPNVKNITNGVNQNSLKGFTPIVIIRQVDTRKD